MPVQAEEREEGQPQPDVGDEGESEPVDEQDDYERLLGDLERLHAEREGFLEQLMRTRADFENYRKRVLRQQSESLERAGEELVVKLLEVLDIFDAAVVHGQGFDQAYGRLTAVLTKEGLDRIDPTGAPFDPNEADAVAHESGEDGPVVSEVLRPGYRWKGRVVRPAMVKVQG
ncbi:MAG: nucleotide exchange factor GrpE [Acidimicrobiales bacterium]